MKICWFPALLTPVRRGIQFGYENPGTIVPVLLFEVFDEKIFYTTIRLQPLISLPSTRPSTSNEPSGYSFPASSVAIKEQV